MPIGSTEQHGPKGLIGTGALCPEVIARSVARRCRGRRRVGVSQGTAGGVNRPVVYFWIEAGETDDEPDGIMRWRMSRSNRNAGVSTSWKASMILATISWLTRLGISEARWRGLEVGQPGAARWQVTHIGWPAAGRREGYRGGGRHFDVHGFSARASKPWPNVEIRAELDRPRRRNRGRQLRPRPRALSIDACIQPRTR